MSGNGMMSSGSISSMGDGVIMISGHNNNGNEINNSAYVENNNNAVSELDEEPFFSIKGFKTSILIMSKLHTAAFVCIFFCTIYIGLFVSFCMSPAVDYELKDIDTSPKSHAAMSVGFAINHGYFILYFLLILRLVYGYKLTRFLIPANVFFQLLAMVVVAIHYSSDEAFRKTSGFYLLLLYGCYLITYIGNAVWFGLRYGVLKVLILFAIAIGMCFIFQSIMDFLVIPFYLETSENEKMILRITICPFLLIFIVVLTRRLGRIIGEKPFVEEENSKLPENLENSHLVSIFPVVLRSFFGRVFVIQSPILSLLYSVVIVILVDILLKLLHWNRVSVFKRAPKFVDWAKDQPSLTPLFGNPKGDVYYGKCLCFEKAAEIAGIGYATSCAVFYQIIFENGGDLWKPFVSAIVQYILESIGQAFALRFERRHKIPVLEIVSDIKFFKQFVIILLLTCFLNASVCTWRAIYVYYGKFP